LDIHHHELCSCDDEVLDYNVVSAPASLDFAQIKIVFYSFSAIRSRIYFTMSDEDYLKLKDKVMASGQEKSEEPS
jgi:DeoR/GlpR family transcriptional regulator of sugar metabolism